MGSFTDVLRQFVEKALDSLNISSAGGDSPKTNYVRDYDINSADFDKVISSEMDKAIRESSEFKPTKEKVDQFSLGNVEKIQNLSSRSFSNLQSIASGPFAFVASVLTSTLAKAVTGVGIALIIMEFVKFAIDESMKPGRILDRRFKRLASEEIMLFMTHQEQEKLRRGFTEVRVTTMGGLRGGASQVNGNLFQHQAISGAMGQPTEYRRDIDFTPIKNNYSNFQVDADGNPIHLRYFR